MKRVLAIGGLIVLIVAAQAVIAEEEANVFTGCLTKGGEIIKVAIDDEPARPCQGQQTQVSWNQSGPEGPAGPAGEQGPPGVSAGQSCPEGEHVVGVDTDGYLVCSVTVPTTTTTTTVPGGGSCSTDADCGPGDFCYLPTNTCMEDTREPDICDDVDNDLDGVVDQDFIEGGTVEHPKGTACEVGGETGEYVCSMDGTTTVCDLLL